MVASLVLGARFPFIQAPVISSYIMTASAYVSAELLSIFFLPPVIKIERNA